MLAWSTYWQSVLYKECYGPRDWNQVYWHQRLFCIHRNCYMVVTLQILVASSCLKSINITAIHLYMKTRQSAWLATVMEHYIWLVVKTWREKGDVSFLSCDRLLAAKLLYIYWYFLQYWPSVPWGQDWKVKHIYTKSIKQTAVLKRQCAL